MITIKNIQKKYIDKVILQDISVSLVDNEIFGLLGVNGAGKSTLASMLAGLKKWDSGDILYLGASITSDLPEYKKAVGYCPQKPNLNAGMTLFDNLYYSGQCYGLSNEEINKNIEYVSSMLDIKHYLKSYESILSGGYKQRFMIARSIIHLPKILILDEPTVGMDPAMRRNVWTLINELKKQGMTIILTTHYLDEAEKLCDRVCFLNRGVIEFIDTPANLLKKTQEASLEDVWLKLAEDTIKDGNC